MMQTDESTVFALWCRLTGTDPDEFDSDERAAFLARPQVMTLAATPYEGLLGAGISAARHGMLPLERWLAAVQAPHGIDA
ncbi:MAG: hypothetical protein QOG80_1199 [Pseudonocardiales bacterium]|jgi:hypothetical protein|nr:hypothetical protein [Pseudonocardiales bacterium]